jgi:hypothetical protein
MGNMEGEDVRFGQAGAALFIDATTGTGTGASNAVLESAAPIAGLVAMFNLLLGCISPGGVGAGLYSLLLLTFIAAFLAALMIGRTPEYLGKKISTRDMQFAMFALLVSPVLLLGLAGASTLLKSALDTALALAARMGSAKSSTPMRQRFPTTAPRSPGSAPTRPGTTSRPVLRCFSGDSPTQYRFLRSPDRSRERRRSCLRRELCRQTAHSSSVSSSA